MYDARFSIAWNVNFVTNVTSLKGGFSKEFSEWFCIFFIFWSQYDQMSQRSQFSGIPSNVSKVKISGVTKVVWKLLVLIEGPQRTYWVSCSAQLMKYFRFWWKHVLESIFLLPKLCVSQLTGKRRSWCNNHCFSGNQEEVTQREQLRVEVDRGG